MDVWHYDASKERRNLYVTFQLTRWCNYSCPYCFDGCHEKTQPWPRRDGKIATLSDRLFPRRRSSAHAFDNYPVHRWVEAIQKIAAGRMISLKITGGEPFLDTPNVLALLKGILPLVSVDPIRFDTNGTFDPNDYRGLTLEKVFLNVSYHPSHIRRDAFLAKVRAIAAAGFRIGMVTMVVTPSQRREFETVKEACLRLGLHVNPNPRLEQPDARFSDYDHAFFSRFLVPFDVENKLHRTDLQRVRCRFPQIGLQIDPDGKIYNACFTKRKTDIFRASANSLNTLLAETACFCPRQTCHCTNMYSFQVGQSRNNASMETMGSYVRNALIVPEG
ncbi:MAG: 4Fe-4S cluster-binding domain-containing protein [Candidatus Omnitrophica bacterium]|nr:4Fe-4S cluster-binding domain-containing protein [Candidatus Omnitrophota bacterium]